MNQARAIHRIVPQEQFASPRAIRIPRERRRPFTALRLLGAALVCVPGMFVAAGCGAPSSASAPRGDSAPLASERVVVGPGGAPLHEYLDRLARLGAFSGAVLVARGDTVLVDGGYGLADQRRGVPVTRSTVFDVGSVAKQFTATAVLRLELDGRLSVDEPLSRLFPEAPAEKRGITLHQLLTHTAGLPGDLETGAARTTAPDDPELAKRLLALPLESEPGSAFRYSNAGYALLRLAIERASGVPFARYVTTRLLQPAGLTRTGWHGDSTLWPSADVARGAWGLYDSGSPRDWPLHGATFGAGEMVTSPGELYRWLRALDAGRVLPEDARRALFTPRTSWSGAGAAERGPAARYAYGWEVRTRANGSVGLVFHNGTYDNFRTTVRRYPSDDSVVIVATNSRQQDAGDRADEVGNTLRDLMLGADVSLAPRTIDLSAEELARFAGTYVLADGTRFEVGRATPDRLWLAPHGQRAFDAIWAPGPERALRQERAARRTVELVEALRSESGDAVESEWGVMFSELVGRFGECERVEFVGVAPLSWSDDGSLTYSTLHFARGRLAVTWVWDGDELAKTMSSVDVPEPQSVPLAPVGPAQFAFYDWFTGRVVPVEFVSVGGASGSLVVGGLSAHRVH